MDRNAPAQGSGRKFFIHTFGCQMNLADSERMAGALESAGYQCTTEAKDANVLVYNTCSIREKAENKVYSALGRQAQRKRAHFGDLKIVVAGCVAQQEGQQLLRRVPEVDIVMGPQHANQIAALLDQANDGQVRGLQVAVPQAAKRAYDRTRMLCRVPCVILRLQQGACAGTSASLQSLSHNSLRSDAYLPCGSPFTARLQHTCANWLHSERHMQ